jgi:hypothetical protein
MSLRCRPRAPTRLVRVRKPDFSSQSSWRLTLRSPCDVIDARVACDIQQTPVSRAKSAQATNVNFVPLFTIFCVQAQFSARLDIVAGQRKYRSISAAFLAIICCQARNRSFWYEADWSSLRRESRS